MILDDALESARGLLHAATGVAERDGHEAGGGLQDWSFDQVSGGYMLGRQGRRGVHMAGELDMSRGQMLDFRRKTLDLVVARIETLPGENAWEDEFRQVLEELLLEAPPEECRPALSGAGRHATAHPFSAP